jgi:hypothetical protein
VLASATRVTVPEGYSLITPRTYALSATLKF